jgi:hypothetical protein
MNGRNVAVRQKLASALRRSDSHARPWRGAAISTELHPFVQLDCAREFGMIAARPELLRGVGP